MNKKEILKSRNPKLLELFELLNELKNVLDMEFFIELKRSLPLNEILTDRWERSSFLGFGEGTSIYDSSLIFGNVSVGKNTWIGPFTILDGSGGLTIGNNCSISTGVQIYSHDSVKWAISGGKESYEYEKTIIGDNCYIGPNVIISKGVVLGDGCIVGANSFVNKSFPAGSKIAGNPARSLEK